MAHINDDGAYQRLIDHLLGTAELASIMASGFGCGEWGYLAGLWHDIGKYSSEFQEKIRNADGKNEHIENVRRVDHSTAGAQHANRTLKDKGFGKAIAYAIAGHHGGLPDGISPDSCLQSRLKKIISDYSNCPESILYPQILYSPLSLPLKPDPKRAGIQFSMFIRLLYSCLCDADFLDTEHFINPEKARRRRGYKPLNELEPLFLREIEKIRDKARRSHVNLQREVVLSQCLSAAEKEIGLFSLTVPTGGGKTLSSMAFALKHALKHGLKRVIYVIPYTSIIEQNANVFRSILGDNCVLEHHSNFEPEVEDYRSRLAAENWDAPIIVTTNVQFFESLLANRSSRCRKLHNITNSVVILDEVQTLPVTGLLPCLETVKELVEIYRVSVVLCSATQPAVQRRDDFEKGLGGVTEIINNPQKLANSLKRTEIRILGKMSNMDLTHRLVEHKQVLCVVNTRRHARELYHAVQPEDGLIHLSALMCPVHRSQKLKEIRERLKMRIACRVISTTLVEAGVDIDFPVVFRSLAGIDSIAQAAGRCNREGMLEIGHVFVFTPENGGLAHDLRQRAETAESVIRRHPEDIFSPDAIEDYFKNYYWLKGDSLDEEGILNDLRSGCLKGDFPFKTIAEKFRIIPDNTKPVIIPFDDDARLLIGKLDHVEHPREHSRKLQKYTVSVYPNEYDNLLISGRIELKAGLFPVLTDHSLYDKNLGLRVDDPAARDPKVLII